MKLKKSKRILNLLGSLSLVVGAVSMSSCDPYLYGDQQGGAVNRQDKVFKDSLALAIARADRVVVEEHSHQSDFFGLIGDTNNAPRYKYGSTELTAVEKNEMLRNVQNMSASVSPAMTNCAFTPHHTIEFYEQGRLMSRMRVCYECSEVQWNGSTGAVPADVINAITPTIRKAGFSTNKNWKSAAANRYSPPIPEPKPTGPPTAKKVPGKPGHVYNPFNQNEVDVIGIPSGLKVRDPNDPDKTHIFKVP